MSGHAVALATRFPLHARAVERHSAWARDFVAVGEFEAAIDALLDLHALASELLDEVEDH